MTRSEYIVNVDGLEWSHEEHGDRFEFHRKWLSAPTGAQKLGCSLYRIPPGKTGFPFHKHFSNEEAIYVIAGEGTLRLEGESFSVGPGDYIAFVPEGPNHQLLNSGTTDLVYSPGYHSVSGLRQGNCLRRLRAGRRQIYADIQRYLQKGLGCRVLRRRMT